MMRNRDVKLPKIETKVIFAVYIHYKNHQVFKNSLMIH